MPTEGWVANIVTHILGVRAFGTHLLCEQVVSRGLRRQSYELNDHGLFDVEYSLAAHLLKRFGQDGDLPVHLFGQVCRVVRKWLHGGYLVLKNVPASWPS